MNAARKLTGDPSVSLYDGRQLLGVIFDRRDGCEAGDADRRCLGKFGNWRDASTAIHQARSGDDDRRERRPHQNDGEASP